MKEFVIISGKGGTGKTSLTACFAALAKNAVLADCDVDAADLHLVIEPEVKESSVFISGNEAIINPETCIACGKCKKLCRFDAISETANGIMEIDPASCEGCGVCVHFCPVQAIDFPKRKCGDWFISKTRFGSMVHAKLGIAAENSGKLVSLVRGEAKKIAEKTNASLVIIDGPPGIGCPVIASITGANAVIAVTEPTLSGAHDLLRVLSLAKFFEIKSYLCVNKWDINPELTEKIEADARKAGVSVLGRISYDPEITTAQIAGKSVVEHKVGKASKEIETIWKTLCEQESIS